MLITLLIAVIALGLTLYFVQILPIAQPFKNIAKAIVILIAIYYVLRFLPA